MGPDEQSTSKYSMIMTPINEDGTYGEPIKFENLKPIAEEDLQDLDSTKKNKLIFNTTWSGEFNMKFKHKKISKKTFKKWCMSRGLSRNASELACQIIGRHRGKISYQKVYMSNYFAPLSYLYIEGVNNSWMKK